MTDISVTSSAYQVEKRSWLIGTHGVDETVGVTLDVSAFNAAQYPNGYIPSGTVVGLISASSTADGARVVGPYDDTATDGRQTAFGILFSSVKVPNVLDTTKDAGGAVLVHGFVRQSKLPFTTGQAGRGYLDAAGIADLS